MLVPTLLLLGLCTVCLEGLFLCLLPREIKYSPFVFFLCSYEILFASSNQWLLASLVSQPVARQLVRHGDDPGLGHILSDTHYSCVRAILLLILDTCQERGKAGAREVGKPVFSSSAPGWASQFSPVVRGLVHRYDPEQGTSEV